MGVRAWRSRQRSGFFASGAAVALASSLVSVAAPAAADEPASTLPIPGATGPRVPLHDPSIMPGAGQANDSCETLIEEGWALANPGDGPYRPRRLEGEVVIGHPPHGDFYFNHDTEDHNFFVYPDNHNALASDPNANYRSLLGVGNFHTGQPKEHGLIEVEWEYGAHMWNDAGPAKGYYYGLPTWAWPNTGDRVVTEGYWTFDCGHEGKDGNFRSEIHPAWFVATIRNKMESPIARGANRHGTVAALGPDDRALSRVTQADVFISSFGGEVVDNIFPDDVYDPTDIGRPDWWQPVNRKDYDFDIPLPPKPSGLPADAQPVIQILDPPADWVDPPGFRLSPTFGMANLSTTVRPGFVHVHIPFDSVRDADYLVFAKRIIVGWEVPEPNAVHLRVNVKRWNVYEDLEGVDEAEYSPWVQSGDQNLFLQISDGGEDDDANTFDCDSDGNYMPYCEPDNEENSYVRGGTFDLFVNPDDPVVLQFKAKESDQPLDENDDAGFASQAFTSIESWGVGLHFLRQNDLTFAGEYKDFTADQVGGGEDPCEDEAPDDRDECYEVTYTIERIYDPTAMSIGVPLVQYAQDPNHFTAKVVTPGSPEKPRRHLPVTFDFSDGTNHQVLHGTTGNDGVAAPTDLLTLPAGSYTLKVSFGGNGLLAGSEATQTVTIERDYTASSLAIEDNELRWGHNDPMTVTLVEPNEGQGEPPLPIPGKNMTVALTGPLGTQTYPAGPTGADGKVTITPLMALPPGNYQATACFAQDPWFRASCSTPQTVKVTGGFAAFTRGGPLNVAGNNNTTLGDVHVEDGIFIEGNRHVLSAGAGERLEYVTTLTDVSDGSSYNPYQVPPLGIAPQYLRSTYCTGANSFMGVPVRYVNSTLTFKNDATISGIYCVTGDIKIQSRVTGQAVLLATGKITTSGGNETLRTADPTGADVLMLAESAASDAISLQQKDSAFTGAIVATGGIVVGSMNSLYDGSLVGQSARLGGGRNTLNGR